MKVIEVKGQSRRVLKISEPTIIRVDGDARVTQIIITEPVQVKIVGGHLTISNRKLGCITATKAEYMSGLSIDLAKLTTKCKVKNFSIGVYGELPQLEDWISPNTDITEVSGKDAFFVLGIVDRELTEAELENEDLITINSTQYLTEAEYNVLFDVRNEMTPLERDCWDLLDDEFKKQLKGRELEFVREASKYAVKVAKELKNEGRDRKNK